jgi:hypothetical protein
VYDFDLWLFALLAVAVGLGGWGIYLARAEPSQGRRAWGHFLFVGTLLVLGAGNVVALSFAAGWLVPFGLAAGWLVIAMLWENPFRGWQES